MIKIDSEILSMLKHKFMLRYTMKSIVDYHGSYLLKIFSYNHEKLRVKRRNKAIFEPLVSHQRYIPGIENETI
jgi:hypothetical protein